MQRGSIGCDGGIGFRKDDAYERNRRTSSVYVRKDNVERGAVWKAAETSSWICSAE
ncbi:hypothetical protein DPMN_007299 [Dreissena polymorpha]|uniref:Uncharacterized protein n=1 Tax=Dreissena polymorpha TaxID=45954 RepID=A0A9D4MX49_DREPO|nr:hypothetical protein DPMN_007299 [Dreissena polymorpha]